MREISPSVTPFWVEQLRKAAAWPAEAIEARRVRAELAALSERELQDIGWARRDDEAASRPVETAADRLARARAVRAWHRTAA